MPKRSRSSTAATAATADTPEAPARRVSQRKRVATPKLVAAAAEAAERAAGLTKRGRNTRTGQSCGAGSSSARQQPGKATAAKAGKAEAKAQARKAASAAAGGASKATVTYRKTPSPDERAQISKFLSGLWKRQYLIHVDDGRKAGAGHATFPVLGTEDKIYNVTVGPAVACECPTHRAGGLCKHILFLLLRVCKLRPDNPLLWQRTLKLPDVHRLVALASAPDPSTRACKAVRDEYVRREAAAEHAVATLKRGSCCPGAGSGADCPAALEDGQECVICFEPVGENTAGRGPPTVCGRCCKHMHQRCIREWHEYEAKKGDIRSLTYSDIQAVYEGIIIV